MDGQWLNDPYHPSARLPSIKPSYLEPAPSPHSFVLDNPPRRCSPTSGATAIPFHILVRDDPLEKLRGRIISGRLGLLIRNIKPKRQRTFISSQPSPSAAKSLFVFNPLGIEKTETDWEENTGG